MNTHYNWRVKCFKCIFQAIVHLTILACVTTVPGVNLYILQSAGQTASCNLAEFSECTNSLKAYFVFLLLELMISGLGYLWITLAKYVNVGSLDTVKDFPGRVMLLFLTVWLGNSILSLSVLPDYIPMWQCFMVFFICRSTGSSVWCISVASSVREIEQLHTPLEQVKHIRLAQIAQDPECFIYEDNHGV